MGVYDCRLPVDWWEHLTLAEFGLILKRREAEMEAERYNTASVICAIYNAAPYSKRKRPLKPEDLIKSKSAPEKSKQSSAVAMLQKAIAITQAQGGKVAPHVLEKLRRLREQEKE